MAKEKPQDSADITDDIAFQRRSWRVQRAGWIVMLLIAVAALSGIFGGGPLSSAETASTDGFRVRYERFIRLRAPQTLHIEAPAAAARADSTLSIWLDRKWLESNGLEAIVPEPESSLLEADRIVYAFRVVPASGPILIRLDLEALSTGSVSGRAGIPGGSSASFTQFAFP